MAGYIYIKPAYYNLFFIINGGEGHLLGVVEARHDGFGYTNHAIFFEMPPKLSELRIAESYFEIPDQNKKEPKLKYRVNSGAEVEIVHQFSGLIPVSIPGLVENCLV
jgi:hypothetical protein